MTYAELSGASSSRNASAGAFFLLLSSGALLNTPAAFARPQMDSAPAIRVESQEVVVPVLVYYQHKSNNLVGGLTVGNFHLFQDGVEQKIERVSPERNFSRNFRDNFGVQEPEWSGASGQRWTILGGGPISGFFRYSRELYSVSYVPPASAEGSCHGLTVTVDRTDVTLLSRNGYCNVTHPSSDPLKGTLTSKRMEDFGASREAGKIPVSVQSGFTHGGTNVSRVHVTVDFPYDAIAFREVIDGQRFQVGILTLAYGADGTLAARSSDLERSGGSMDPGFYGGPSGFYAAMRALIPNHHEAQMDLPPGNYRIEVIVTDGTNFGRAETSLAVDSYDGQGLDISSVIICKQFNDPKQNLPLPSRSEHRAWFSESDASPKPSADFAPLVSKGMEFTPAGDTRVNKADPLFFVYYQIDDPLLPSTPNTTVQVRTRIINTQTHELETDTGWRSTADWIQPGNSVVAISQQIATDKLNPGPYRIDVQSSDSAGSVTAWRSADFTVEGSPADPRNATLQQTALGMPAPLTAAELKGKSRIPPTITNLYVYVQETTRVGIGFQARIQKDMQDAAKNKKGSPCFALVSTPKDADAILVFERFSGEAAVWLRDTKNGSALWGKLDVSADRETDYVRSNLYRAAGCSANGVRKKK